MRGRAGGNAVVRFSLAAFLLAALGCEPPNMQEQPRYTPLDPSLFFPDGRSARHPVAGTVPRGHLKLDPRFYEGKVAGKPIAEIPVPVTAELLARGRDRYEIWCQVCHDRMGTGNGMIVQRGYKRPPPYDGPRLLASPPGHFFDVISNGWGAMAAYGPFVEPADRWAIVAYIRALQIARTATLDDVPPEIRAALESAARPDAAIPPPPAPRALGGEGGRRPHEGVGGRLASGPFTPSPPRERGGHRPDGRRAASGWSDRTATPEARP